MSERKLWKVISLSAKRGNRISQNLPYGEAFAKYQSYRTELLPNDTLLMVQVLEIAKGGVSVSATEDVLVRDVGDVGYAFDNVRSL